MSITPHHDVGVATRFVMSGLSSVAFKGVQLRPFDFSSKRLKVRIDDVGGWELFVVVLECKHVLPLLRHVHPDSRLTNPSTIILVLLKQVLPGVAMQAALTEVFAVFVFGLIIKESVEVLVPGVVRFSRLFDQQQVDPGKALWLFADIIDSPYLDAS